MERIHQDIIEMSSWENRIVSKPSTMLDKGYYCLRIQYDILNMKLNRKVFHKIFPLYYPVEWMSSIYLNRQKRNWIYNNYLEGIIHLPLPGDLIDYIMKYV